MQNRKWIYNNIDEVKAARLARELDINPLLIRVLFSRGLDNAGSIREFLYGWKDIQYDPFLMKDMDKAAEIVKDSISKGHRITVYGDYDCDGITSTAILVDFIRTIGGKVDYYIPDRLTDGYGISIEAINKILNIGMDLIITVDCGITAVKEAAYLKQNNILVVITDHHQCAEKLPEADAVVNPYRPDCQYPFKGLAGVGVAYKLIQAICIKYNLGDIYNKYIDLVTLGTIADVVSMTGENRNIVAKGLKNILQPQNPGLNALVQISGINKYKISTQSFAFGLSPRINAAGRMGNAELAIQLVLAGDHELAKELAYLLDVSNKQRQFIEGDNLNTAIKIIEENSVITERKIIVVSSEKFHHGVVGIVASKITELYNKPSILLVEEEDENGLKISRGSARSIEGINLYKALAECKDVLIGFGGHASAAGLSIETRNIGLLAERLSDTVSDIDDSIFEKVLKADAFIEADWITVENVDSLSLLEPFGYNNEEPLFISGGMTLKNIRALGEDGKHLKLTFVKNGAEVNAIAFNIGKRRSALQIGDKYDVAYYLENNVWKDRATPQLRIIDIIQSGQADICVEENC